MLRKIETLEEICKKLNAKGEVERLQKLKERLESPFLIAVFGEVNAGKSSFLNALLGIPDLCKTDVDICTDRITVIGFSEKPYRKPVDEITEEVGVNNPLLKGFKVVDTPGINSVLEHHTLITERFLPESDAILVVIPALNPHTKPIWDWIEKISKEFGRKIVFILQQSDLLSEEGLKTIVKRVEQYARERGVAEPKVFPVSALLELSGKPRSGFGELRRFLKERYTGEEQLRAKYETVRDELIKLYSDCIKRVEELTAEAEKLRRKMEETLEVLKERRKNAEEYKKLLLQSIENKVNKIADRVSQKLEKLSLIDITFRKRKVEEFLQNLKGEIEGELKEFLEGSLIPKLELFESGVLQPALEEAVKRMEEFKRFSEKVGKGKKPLRGEEILRRLEEGVGSVRVAGGEGAVAVMGGSLLAGSLLALLGGSLAVDLTGGLITAVGLSLGSLYLLGKKRKLEKELRTIFERELGEELKQKVSRVVEERLKTTIDPMIEYLGERINSVGEEIERLKTLRGRLLKSLSELKRFEP